MGLRFPIGSQPGRGCGRIRESIQARVLERTWASPKEGEEKMKYDDYKIMTNRLLSASHHYALSFYTILLSRGVDEENISMGNCSISHKFSSILFLDGTVCTLDKEPFVSACDEYLMRFAKREAFYLKNEKELFTLADLFINGNVVDGARSVFDENSGTFKRFLRRKE